MAMTPEVERFLDLATRELEGNLELREEARGELMGRINHQGMPLEMIDLSEPVERLEKAKVGKPWPRRIAMLVATIGLLLLTSAMVGLVAWKVTLSIQAQMLGFSYMMGGGSSPQEEESMLSNWAKDVAPNLPLVGPSRSELERAVRNSPDDVALFQQLLISDRMKHSGSWTGLSEEQRETAERIDPGNGFYDFLEMEGHCERSLSGGSSRTGKAAKVTDEAAFSAALESFEKAASAERFHDASGELRRRQLDAFPKQEEFIDQFIHAAFAEFIQSSVPEYHFYSSPSDGSLIEKQVERLRKKSDVEGLLALNDGVRSLGRKMLLDTEGGGMDTQGVINRIEGKLTSVEDGLVALGEKSKAKSVGELTDVLRHGDLSLSGLDWGDESPSMRLNEWQDVPSDLTLDEAIPAGKSELAYINWIIALFGALLVVPVVLCMAIEAYRRPRRVKGMAKGLMPILSWRDQLWIGGLGIALPWLWFAGVSLMTPLGMRDISFSESDGLALLVMLVQAASTLVFSLVMIVWTSYWRWEKRAGVLAFQGGAMLLGRISGYLAAAAVPAIGLIRYFDRPDEDQLMIFFLGVSGLAVTGILWLLWIAILNLCTPQSNALRANVVMRTGLPWMLGALASLLLCAGIQRAVEQHWVSKDTLFPSWTSSTHVNALEERIEREVRERVLGLMEDGTPSGTE